MRKQIHSPTLDSVRMVENTILKYTQEYSKYQLWKKLPKKMMYQTFCIVFDYLLESGKIMVDKRDGIVFWTYDPETIKDLRKRGLEYNAKDFD